MYDFAHKLIIYIPQAVKAFMLAAGFYFLLNFILIYTDPFIPRMIDKHDFLKISEKIQVTESGHYYIMRPIDQNQIEPFTPEGIRIRENTLKSSDPRIPDESINPRPPEHNFDELPKSESLPAHELKSFLNHPNILEYWYLVQHRDPFPHGYFEGFDSQTGKSLGFIGKSGLIDHCPTPDESIPLMGILKGEVSPPRSAGYYNTRSLPSIEYHPESWEFQLTSQRRVWIATPGGIQVCDLTNRTVKSFTPVQDLLFIDFIKDNNKLRNWILLRTTNTIKILDENGTQTHLANHKFSQKTNINLFPLKSGELVIVQTNPSDHGTNTIETSIYWYNDSGNLVKKKNHSLNTIVFPPKVQREVSIISINNLTQIFVGFLGGPYPDNDTVQKDGAYLPGNIAPYVWCNLGLTLTCLLLVIWRQRQSGQRYWTTLGWVAFTLVLGVAGYLGYLFHKRWPRLVACPCCFRKRPVDRIKCPACGAGFVKPQLTGNEIISPDPIRLMAQPA